MDTPQPQFQSIVTFSIPSNVLEGLIEYDKRLNSLIDECNSGSTPVDIHSQMAKEFCITREEAKRRNYIKMYSYNCTLNERISNMMRSSS